MKRKNHQLTKKSKAPDKRKIFQPKDINEEMNFRESASLESEDIRPDPDTSINWSEPEDRSEELINETDPFIQEPTIKPRFLKDDKF